KAKIYMVALPDGTLPNNQTAGPYLTQLYQTVAQAGRPNATIFVLDGTTVFAGSGALREGVAGRLANLAASNNPGDPVAVTKDFIERVNLAAQGDRSALSQDSLAGDSSGGGSGAGVL